MNDDKVIGLYGGPLDGERRTVDVLPPIYSETLDDGTEVRYESRAGLGHSVGLDPFVLSYDFIEP